MPIRPPEYDLVARWLEPTLDNLPPKLVAIVGLMGAGKTTLARFLAWYFNVSLIETDHYLAPHKGIEIEPKELNRIIEHRMSIRRPVIVEGAAIFPLLAKIERIPDAVIRVQNKLASRRPSSEEIELLNPRSWAFDNCPLYEMMVEHDG